MPRIGANRPLDQRVIYELGEDYQLEDLGGGASASFAESALFVTAGWPSTNVAVTFAELYFGSADTLALAAQLPANDIAVGPGLYNISFFADPSGMGDATILSASLVVGSTGAPSFVTPAQTSIFVVGGPVSWDNFDVSTTLFVPEGEVGSISVWTADDHTVNAVVADMNLVIFRIFDFAGV